MLIFAKPHACSRGNLAGMMEQKKPQKHRISSAGVVIVHAGPEQCRYLLLRCYHYWDFPKGGVEPGEKPFAAACREVREETTLDALEFAWGQVYMDTPPYGFGKVVRYYLARSASDSVALPVNAALGHPEHHEYRWLEYRAARSLLTNRVVPVLDWAHTLTGC